MNNLLEKKNPSKFENIDALKGLVYEFGFGNIHDEILKAYFALAELVVSSDHDSRIYELELNTLKLLYEAFRELEKNK